MRRILVDFDGVLHDYIAAGGWQGAGHIPGVPKLGALEWLNSLLAHFEVCVYSTRSSQVAGLLAMQRWLKQHWPKTIPLPVGDDGELLIKFPREKPPALLTIDDRCIRFAGRFPPAEELAVYRAYDEPVTPYVPDGFRVTPASLLGRVEQLSAAGESYRRLGRELGRADWSAQLNDIARQVEALADEIEQAAAGS